MRALVASVALAGVLVSGCSDGTDEARDLARQACEYPAPEAPGYDPQTADLALLADLDATAQARADLAEQAAALDERWQPLSDAAAALAAFASRIREIRREGGVVAEEMPSAVWEQVKYASDAFILECRPVVGA